MIRLLDKIKFLKNLFFFSKSEKEFIKNNKFFFKNNNNNYNNNNSKNVILVDLFDWFPWIHFWSFLVNKLAAKTNSNIHFFYFRLYEGFFSKFIFYTFKLKKIYKSFGASSGIDEFNLNKKLTNINNIQKKIKNIKNKKQLYNYKYKNIRIGDLIYSNYLRVYLQPTVRLGDKRLEEMFIRAHVIFDNIVYYMSKFNVRCLVPSHLCYIPYGLISRIAQKKYKVPIIKIFSKNRGKNLFRLIKIDDNLLDENPYYNFKKNFSKLSKFEKIKALKIGKKIINQRLSNDYDPNLPYMKQNQFNNKTNFKIMNNKNLKNIFLFAHCYFDNPMRYRNMIFTDFFEQVNYLLKISKVNKGFQWFYKPHPNELKNNENYIYELKKKYPNVIFLGNQFSHNLVLKLDPYLIITNFGTVAHEFAYFKIPVINTGDNPHINYNFSLNPKNKNELKDMIINLNKYKLRLNFKKKNIYEYLYFQYYHYSKKYNAKKLIKDKKLFFDNSNIESNQEEIIKNINKNFKANSISLSKYIDCFLNENFYFLKP